VQDQFQAAAGLANSVSATTKGTPDVGILSKDFFKTKGREPPVDRQFAIHRKKRAAAVDVDVGILGNGNGRRRQQTSDANLYAMNKVTGRSLQSEEELPDMCPLAENCLECGTSQIYST
jgi:hypothetical protein